MADDHAVILLLVQSSPRLVRHRDILEREPGLESEGGDGDDGLGGDERGEARGRRDRGVGRVGLYRKGK
jgi:hypothetical protein